MSARIDIGEELIERIARRVVELLHDEGVAEQARRYVDAATLARDLGVEREWVYENAERLGAIRLGGSKGRMRFDREVVKQRLGASEEDARSRRRPTRRLAKPTSRQRKAGVKSPQTQRRASVGAPARSPKRHQPGGSPE